MRKQTKLPQPAKVERKLIKLTKETLRQATGGATPSTYTHYPKCLPYTC